MAGIVSRPANKSDDLHENISASGSPRTQEPPRKNPLTWHSRRFDRLAERETVIQYDDAGENARVFTRHRGLASNLMRRGIHPTSVDRRGAKGASWWFAVPKSWVNVRPPPKSPEEPRAEAGRTGTIGNPPKSAAQWQRS